VDVRHIGLGGNPLNTSLQGAKEVFAFLAENILIKGLGAVSAIKGDAFRNFLVPWIRL
jgi:hypothetical protein